MDTPLDLSRLTPEDIDHELQHHGFMVFSNDELRTLCEAARAEYLQVFASSELHPTAERFTYPTLCERGHWRKAAISSRNGVGESYAQLLVTTYFAPDAGGCNSLRRLFDLLVEIRNRAMRVRADFGRDPQRDGFWNATRIHHYPVGGGFMVQHRDTHFPLQLGDKPYYQVGVLLSRRGRDFERGGGFVVSNGNRCDLEEVGGFGSIVIFDGRTEHGVDDVDTHRLLDLRDPAGRVAGFVNIYNYQP